MSLKTTIFTLSIVLFGFTSFTGNAGVIFSDSFESGDMSATSTDGFSWDKNNSTSIVTQDQTDGPVAIYNNQPIYNIHDTTMPDGSTRNWTAKVGANSLRFRYAAGANWSEQRYDLGKGYPEIWISYWIRVPTNYKRGLGSSNVNNKWFDILMGPMSQYSNGTVSRIEMQDWPGSSNSMNINIAFRNGSDGKYKNSNMYSQFVTPADAGKWMHLVYQLRASATTSTTDGIIRMYRRWENETGYTLINELVNLNVGIGAGSVSSGYLGWGSGYFMGYANSPYNNDTEWLIDDFIVSDTSLFLNPPKPPSSITVN